MSRVSVSYVSRGLSRHSAIFINLKSFLIVLSYVISTRLLWNVVVMASELDMHNNKLVTIHSVVGHFRVASFEST